MLLSEALKSRNKTEATAIKAVEEFELKFNTFQEETKETISSMQEEIENLKKTTE